MNTAHKISSDDHTVEVNRMKVVYLKPEPAHVVHITDDDYRHIVEKVLEKGHQVSVSLTTSVEIPKPEGTFYFDITSKIWEVDCITVDMFDEYSNELDTDFDTERFYEVLYESKMNN